MSVPPLVLDRRLSVAPMMEWTDRHCRSFHRLLAPRALLYTEMVTAAAIRYGPAERLLAFDAAEHPVALQLGGADPALLAYAAQAGATYGYDEINLNCGCPSDRVQSGRFGACLMAEPALVAECVAAMREAVSLPVTVKTRIGIDDSDGYDFLARFVATVADAGCGVFVIHARKAWLKGLSPKENREIPPLDYGMVHRLKADFPALTIVLNGRIRSAESARAQLPVLDGVMIGREAYENPWSLASFSAALQPGARTLATRHEVFAAFRPYLGARLAEGVPLKAMTRHVLGLFNGLRGARAWRRHLSEAGDRCGIDVLDAAAALVAEQPPPALSVAA